MATVNFARARQPLDPNLAPPDPSTSASDILTRAPQPSQPSTSPLVQPQTVGPGRLAAVSQFNNPVASPVATAPYTPPAAPYAQNAAGRGVSPEQYYRDYLANFHVNLQQANPAGWAELVKAMNDEGYNVSLDQRPDGMHKGIMLNGQFVKLADGNNNPIWMPGGDVAASGAGGAGTSADPNSELYFNELLQRMTQLRQPVNDPMAPLYQLMAMQRVQGLQGAPYTAGEDAAMTAHYMNPLTQARDQQLQQNKEQIGARGMLPTSGLLQELNKGTSASYQQGVATGANDLAVRAVDEKQRRQDEALQVLSQALGQSRSMRTENNQQADELINLASQFPAFDERRLSQLIQASGDNSAAQGSTALIDQGRNQLQQSLLTANNQASRDAAWGQFFASILNNWGSIFK